MKLRKEFHPEAALAREILYLLMHQRAAADAPLILTKRRHAAQTGAAAPQLGVKHLDGHRTHPRMRDGRARRAQAQACGMTD